MMGRALALLAALAVSACAPAIANLPLAFQGGFAVEERPYGARPWEALDVYVPEGEGPWDVVVFFHGGRWSAGRKEDYRFVGATLARRGFVAVIPDYRKYPAVRFPTFMEDGARSLAWAHANVAALGGDPGRIHVAGHSSGAHMGALLVADESYLAAQGRSVGEVVASFAGLAGPYDFTPEDADLVDLFGPPSAFPQMQATRFIAGDEPPMLLLHGASDGTVEAYNHERLAARIEQAGGAVEVVVYPGLGHLGIIADFSWLGSSSPVVEDMIRFFRGVR